MANLDQIRARIREYAQNDGAISNDEWNRISATGTNDEIEISADGRKGNVDWKQLIASLQGSLPAAANVEPGSAAQLTELLRQLTGDYGEFLHTKTQLEQLANGSDPNKQAELLAKKAILTERMNGALKHTIPLAEQFGKTSEMNADWFAAGEYPMPDGFGENNSNNTRVQINPRGQVAGGEQGQKSAGLAGARGETVRFPSLRAEVAGGGGSDFSTDAYMRSLSIDNAVLQTVDTIQENSKRGRQLVMLFAYFAQRAMSGDMGAMFQFQKFLTYIISKDKAKQQIDLGKKLIALQDDSRRATNELLNTKFDANDPNASFEQSKLLTKVKAETDAIATSQKLISQSMEEFGVVVETLTSLEKNALESYKRVQQTLAR